MPFKLCGFIEKNSAISLHLRNLDVGQVIELSIPCRVTMVKQSTGTFDVIHTSVDTNSQFSMHDIETITLSSIMVK